MGVGKSGGVLAAAVLSLFLIPILTFYMLRDWDSFILHLGALVPESQRDTVFELAKETDDMLGAFLRGQLLVMLALAIIYTVGLSIVGLEFCRQYCLWPACYALAVSGSCHCPWKRRHIALRPH